MNNLVIFGAGSIGRLACWYFEKGSNWKVQAFCVDDEFRASNSFCGKPVLPFSELAENFPRGSCHIFVALGYQQLNSLREEAISRFTGLGYELASCVSSHARILNDGNYGKNCFIMENAILQPFTRIGDGAIVWSGAIVAHESVIGSNCFLSAGSVVGGMSSIGDKTFLGMNATVRNGISIGRECIIGANSLALTDLEERSLVSVQTCRVHQKLARDAMRFIDL